MNKFPQPFWAVVLAGMGVALCILVLYSGSEKDIKIAVIGVGASLITGALGYIGGHAAASPTTPADPATTIGR